MSSDIRKWFMKAHNKGKGNGDVSKPVEDKGKGNVSVSNPAVTTPTDTAQTQESSGRRKTSKYFSADKQKLKDEKVVMETPVKRKIEDERSTSSEFLPSKKTSKVMDSVDDDDFVISNSRKKSVDSTPSKKIKNSAGKGVSKKAGGDESDEDVVKEMEDVSPKSRGRGRGGRAASGTPSTGRGRGVSQNAGVDESDEDAVKEIEDNSQKSGGRGRGSRGASGVASAGRGRGAGRGGFMNFGERKDPPHKGEKEVPEGLPDCLAGLTFVISGTLDSLEREEAEDLIKRHGGRVTGSISKKTNYLLCDEDIGGRKSSKAKELGTAFLTEDGLFDLIRKSGHTKVPLKDESKKAVASLSNKAPQKVNIETKSPAAKAPDTSSKSTSAKQPARPGQYPSLSWTEKYRPKVPNEMVGNQSVVNQLRSWLGHWNEQFSGSETKGKGKMQSDPGAKKAVLLSGTPGIGKTTAAKLVSQMLGFQMIEVNASDSRGKADSNISKGIGGSNANSIKELVSNESLGINMDRSKLSKTVLIMDEVDGMSAGDRGGVADLIASIKISKIPIICICNDRYSQKLKSLVNHCLLISFRKPTKQQMAKRLMQVANAEGLQVNEIALEELAERVNGDMRMALNQLQYMSLSMSVIKYDDLRKRLLSSSKDEDISPFTAVDKLFGFNGGKLRMDERVDLSMSDPDLVPLIIQENYINYRPSSVARDDIDGIKRMNLIARAAESIGDGDIINVQIRRYRQWQLSQTGCLASCIIPSALLHGQRETLEQGERNFNRFGGWLGKNSTAGKNYRLLEDLHVHFLASRETSSGRETIRLDYLTLLLKQLTDPLRALPKDEAVKKVVEFMNVYSISQEDFDTIVELSKFQGHQNPLEGVLPAVKAALTKAYKEGSKTRTVRAADLISLPGIKKAPKKRIAAILEPSDDGIGEENGENDTEENDNTSDAEELETAAGGEKLRDELQSLNSKGIEVELELKDTNGSASKKAPAGRGRGGGMRGAAGTSEKKGGRGSGSGAKRKR